MGAIRKLKRILEQNIRDISKDVSAFVREPGRDFTRTRKLGFEDVMRFIISGSSGVIVGEKHPQPQCLC